MDLTFSRAQPPHPARLAPSSGTTLRAVPPFADTGLTLFNPTTER